MNLLNWLAVAIQTDGIIENVIEIDWLGEIIQSLIKGCGSIGLGVIVFTLILKLITLPFDIMSRVSTKKNTAMMEKMRPELERLQRQYSNNAELYQRKMQELYKSYHMTREARIKRLGETLSKINDALEAIDLTTVAPDKLLDYKLKYTEALKNEFIEPSTNRLEGDFTAKDILGAIGDLLNRIKAGTVTPEQATKESQVYSNLLKAYENVELAEKISLLEGIIGGRN